jgi:hypothetical protein
MCQAGSGAVQAKDSNNIVTCGSASQYKTASKKRRTENPATRTSSRVLWQEGVLVWALPRLGEWRALLSEEAAERDLGEIVGATSKRAIRFFSLPARRFGRGPA